MHSKGRMHVASQLAHVRACRFASAIFAKRLDPGSDLFDAVGLGQNTPIPVPADHIVRMKRGGKEDSDAIAPKFVCQLVCTAPGVRAGGHIQNDDVDVPRLRCAQGS